jgi:hypothetical protein
MVGIGSMAWVSKRIVLDALSYHDKVAWLPLASGLTPLGLDFSRGRTVEVVPSAVAVFVVVVVKLRPLPLIREINALSHRSIVGRSML